MLNTRQSWNSALLDCVSLKDALSLDVDETAPDEDEDDEYRGVLSTPVTDIEIIATRRSSADSRYPKVGSTSIADNSSDVIHTGSSLGAVWAVTVPVSARRMQNNATVRMLGDWRKKCLMKRKKSTCLFSMSIDCSFSIFLIVSCRKKGKANDQWRVSLNLWFKRNVPELKDNRNFSIGSIDCHDFDGKNADQHDICVAIESKQQLDNVGG